MGVNLLRISNQSGFEETATDITSAHDGKAFHAKFVMEDFHRSWHIYMCAACCNPRDTHIVKNIDILLSGILADDAQHRMTFSLV